MKRIEITVSPTGETSLQTRGFQGKSCQQASDFLERALGQATAEQLTAEYRLPQVQSPAEQVKHRPGS